MSLFKLVIHSFSIIAVFKYTVFLRSTLIIIFLSFLTKFWSLYVVSIQFLIVIFNLLIFLTSLRENEKALINIDTNKENEIDITH